MEYLVSIEDGHYEMTLEEILATANDGYEFNTEDIKAYTGVKDIKGNKIYDGDTVLERGHYVNSDRIVYQEVNYAPNHGAWLRGKTQRLTPKNVKSYKIEVIDRRSKKFFIPKSGCYRVVYGEGETERAEVEYYSRGDIIINHRGLHRLSEQEEKEFIERRWKK